MFKRLIKALDNIADAIDSLVEKLDTVIIAGRVLTATGKSLPLERVDVSDPDVQKALNTPKKSSRWTEDEEGILIGGYAMHWTPLRISQELAKHGYDRSPEKCIGHMYEIRKRKK